MERRRQKTRQATFDALISLLETKPYSKITVQEIIDTANIGRSTFYSHFETKDELLRALCDDVFAHVFSEHLAKERTHDFSRDEQTLENEVTHILYHLQDSKHSIRRLLSSESGEVFMSYLKGHITRALEEKLGRSSLPVPDDYLVNSSVCSFAETIRWWMEHDGYAPEDVARFFFKVNPFLKA